MKDYYKVLGIPRTASPDEIKNAYRKLIRDTHPDYHPDDKDLEERAKEINEAYGILSDTDKKREYDAKLSQKSFSTENPINNINPNNIFDSIRKGYTSWTSEFDPVVEFDKFMKFLINQDKETAKYGLSTEKYREGIKSRRGQMSIREILNEKHGFEEAQRKAKHIGELIDKFINEYNSYKEELERQGETLEGDFSRYLDYSNIRTLKKEEINKAILEMRGNYYDKKRKINERINKIVTGYNYYGFSAIMFLAQRNVLDIKTVSKENMEELESMLTLMKQIDEKMKTLKSSVRELISRLKFAPSKLSIEILTLINKNIDEELIKGMFAKHRIMNMNIVIPENREEISAPKM